MLSGSVAPQSNTTSVRVPGFSAAVRRCDWLHFTARSGQEGETWAAGYRCHLDLVGLSQKALKLMRTGQMDAGYEVLQQFGSGLEALNSPASMRAVMQRWFYGASGYYFYCVGRFDRAHEDMQKANDAVVEAVTHARFLIMLAADCQEFCLHHARIARNQRNWPVMQEHIGRAGRMIEGCLPLCQTAQGNSIYVSTLAAFVQSLGTLSVEEVEATRWLVDEGEKERLFDHFVRGMLRLPGFAIEYN
jgi:hypothetical protein